VAQALVPLKDLVQAKSRLGGLLRPSERRALAQAMVEDVLAVLASHAEIVRVTLVSDDPGAAMLAARYGIDCWTERSLGCSGLNTVVGRASERLLASAVDDTLVVLHGDLPLLSAEDISCVLQTRQATGGLVIGCDRQRRGTNLLAFASGQLPRFCFGVDSCARHLAAAGEAGVSAQVLQRSGIALDIDEPGDLAVLMGALDGDGAGQTCELLLGTPLGARIELAVATLVGHARHATTRKAN
jgi:2-phospho-L-lactate guanylyltransferase